MQRTVRWLAVLLGVIVGGLALAPRAEARHFRGFGFGGYPFYGAAFYGPQPPVYYVPRVAYIPPPLVYRTYTYGYHYRRVHRPYRRIVQRSRCSCHCCR